MAAHERGEKREANPHDSRKELVLAIVWWNGWNVAEQRFQRAPTEATSEGVWLNSGTEQQGPSEKCNFCGEPATGQTFLGSVCRNHGG